MKNISKGQVCVNCGAAVTSEICPYCGSPTGLVTAQADMEYPVIECKEASVSFWNFVFPMIFAVSFGFFGTVFPFLFLMNSSGTNEDIFVLLICIPFFLIGAAALIIAIIPVIRFLRVKIHGQIISATVYGYVDDNVLLNGVPAQVVKLLVDTNQGKRFIMYQLGKTTQPYGINSRISLQVYKNLFLIKPENETYF